MTGRVPFDEWPVPASTRVVGNGPFPTRLVPFEIAGWSLLVMLRLP